MNQDQRKEIRKALELGVTKRALFREYSTDFDPEKLSFFLASRITPAMRKRIRPLNIQLISFWVFIFLHKLILSLNHPWAGNLLVLYITGMILFRITRYSGEAYFLSSVWAVVFISFTVFSISQLTEYRINYDVGVIVEFAFLSVYALILVLSVMIHRWAFSHYRWFRPRKLKDGTYRLE